MKIIILGPNYDNYNAASYQYEFMNALKKECDQYFHYYEQQDIEIEELIKKAKFIPDVIFYNHGWLTDNINLRQVAYLNLTGKSPSNIKHIIFLNKEYNSLDRKIEEIKKFKFDLILTHLHDLKKIKKISFPLEFLPLACNQRYLLKTKHRSLHKRKYDLYFSGILQNWDHKETQSDLRKRIQSELFYCIFDFPIFKKIKYWNLNIYWKPFYKNRFKNIISNFFHGKKLNQKDYFDKLTDSKCVLHTSSPMGIISTRVFEAMGAGSIGLYSKDSNADILFTNNVHFMSFSGIDDFVKKLYSIKYSKISSSYQSIADKGRITVENEHTWEKRVSKFIKIAEI